MRLQYQKIISNTDILLNVFSKLVTLLLSVFIAIVVSTKLSDVDRGVFFTFLALSSSSVLFDLGLNNIAVQYLSHNSDRLTYQEQFIQTVVINSKKISFLLFLTLSFVGYILFASYDFTVILSWVLFSISSAFYFQYNLRLSIFEGQAYTKKASKFRFSYTAINSILLLFLLWFKIGLFSLSIAQIVAIVLNKKAFFFDFSESNPNFLFNYRSEVWPLQKRHAITALSAFIAGGAIVPYSFTLSPAFAGQLGFTLSITNALIIFATTIIQTKNSFYCRILVESGPREYKLIYFKHAMPLFVITAILGLCLYFLLENHCLTFIINPDSILSGVDLFLLFVIVLSQLLVYLISTFVRNFKIEPFTVQSVITSFFLLVFLAINFFLNGDQSSIVMILVLVNIGISLPICLYIYNTHIRRLS